MLRAVTFDFWNTLFADIRGAERERLRAALLDKALVAAGCPVPAHRLEHGLRAAWDYFDVVWLNERRTPLCDELLDAILAALQVRLAPEIRDPLVGRFEQLVLELPPEPMPGAVSTLPRIAERYRLAIICDTGYSPGSVLRRLLDEHDMLGHFNYTYFSNEHGMSKPDVRAFLHTLGELDVSPAEAAHVGDIQRTDIAGAQASGMSAIHFVGANDADVPHSTADAIVSHFEDLPQALGGLIRVGG
jgi:putative hydrolase of the HAD superfamily